MPAWSPVCVLWKQSALWVFYPTHQAKPGAPQKRGDWAKFTHAQILNYTHTHTHGVWTCSKLSNARILRIHAHTYGVHCHAPSCENLDKCMNSSTSLSTVSVSSADPSLRPLSPPSPPPPLFRCHFASLISTFSVLSDFISSYSAPPLVPAECTWVTLLRWRLWGR